MTTVDDLLLEAVNACDTSAILFEILATEAAIFDGMLRDIEALEAAALDDQHSPDRI